MELLDCALVGVYAVTRSNTVHFKKIRTLDSCHWGGEDTK